MKPHRKQKLLVIALILGVLSMTVSLVLYGMSKNINLFFSPTDIAAGKAKIGVPIKVGGLVVEGSFKREKGSLEARFDLSTHGDVVTVLYSNILPDLFREGQGIIAVGQLVDQKTFKATEIIAKHDEEYMPPEVAKALKGVQHVPASENPKYSPVE